MITILTHVANTISIAEAGVVAAFVSLGTVEDDRIVVVVVVVVEDEEEASRSLAEDDTARVLGSSISVESKQSKEGILAD